MEKRCKNPYCCFRCRNRYHDEEYCNSNSSEWRCVNCNGHHHSYSKKCPKFIEMKNSLVDKETTKYKALVGDANHNQIFQAPAKNQTSTQSSQNSDTASILEAIRDLKLGVTSSIDAVDANVRILEKNFNDFREEVIGGLDGTNENIVEAVRNNNNSLVSFMTTICASTIQDDENKRKFVEFANNKAKEMHLANLETPLDNEHSATTCLEFTNKLLKKREQVHQPRPLNEIKSLTVTTSNTTLFNRPPSRTQLKTNSNNNSNVSLVNSQVSNTASAFNFQSNSSWSNNSNSSYNINKTSSIPVITLNTNAQNNLINLNNNANSRPNECGVILREGVTPLNGQQSEQMITDDSSTNKTNSSTVIQLQV
jgi:hypothetical protein